MIARNPRGTMLHFEEDSRFIQFTPKQLQDLVDMYLGGQSPRMIGERYGICAFTVRRRLIAMGIEIRPRGRQGYLVTTQVLATTKAMRERGERWKDVEAATGVRSDTLMLALRRERKKNQEK